MRLISFDIGIKNLAYVVFDINENTLNIIEWNIVNLLDDNLPVAHCNCKNTTNKEICNKPAKYTKNNCNYCEKHAKKNTLFLIRPKNRQLNSLKKMKMEELLKLQEECNMTGEETQRKQIKKDIVEKLDGFFKEKCYDTIELVKNKTSDNTDLITIGKNIKKILNNIKNFENVTDVIIENQYSSLAIRMRTIQGMLTQYFIMKNENINIEYISSQNKLKIFNMVDSTQAENVFTNMAIQPDAAKKIKEKYKKNKTDSIKHTHLILENNDSIFVWKSLFENNKKKDDLSDCFLQAIWFLVDKNKIKINGHKIH
jgi:hypothetical protein